METFTQVLGRVYDIKVDVDCPGSLLFSTSYGFYTVIVNSKPRTPYLIVGNEGNRGYLEGHGKSRDSSTCNQLVRQRLCMAQITVRLP